MDNQDTLLNQIKSAAQNAESKEFPAMDKVWNRVEDKLDHKVLTKQNTLWKKIAVAASILLVVSIGYQFLKEEERIIITPQNSTATITDTTTTVLDSTENKNAIAVVTEKNPNIKTDAEKVLEKQINEAPTVAANEMVISESDAMVMQAPIVDPATYNMASVVTNNGWTAERNFKSRGVTYEEVIKANNNKITVEKPVQTIKKKEEPLYVVDDKKADLSVIKDANEEDFESIVHLPNPLYIINGVYYTEQEVFGPNPTSPYSPLNKQEIETISILQDEKAISIYGEKGKNGVVIITTKNGKPTPKKKE